MATPLANGSSSIYPAIVLHFASQWEKLGRDELLFFENETTDEKVFPGAGDAWARVTFTGNSGTSGGIGERISNQIGNVVVECFVPTGTGTLRVREMLDTTKEILQGATIGGASLGMARETHVGLDPGGGKWWKENVSFPFWFHPAPSS